MIRRIVLPVCLFAAALSAQPFPDGGRPGPNFDAVKEALGIDDAQIAQIQQVRQATRAAVEPLAEQVRDQRQALRELLDSGSAEPAEVGTAVLAIERIGNQIKELHDSARQQIVSIVDAGKLAELEAAAALTPAIVQARMLGLLEGPGGPGRRGLGPGGPDGGPGPLGRDFGPLRGFRGRLGQN